MKKTTIKKALLDDYGKSVQTDHAKAARKTLKAEGLSRQYTIVVADDLHLQVDIDNKSINSGLPNKFWKVFAILLNTADANASIEEITRSRNGNGQHVIIRLSRNMYIRERLFWQSVLGSDPIREALALHSIKKQDKNPILLFERKRT